MNILPKKSWHVRTKKNIDRVNRDEAKAAEEEKEIQRRISLAEQEARTELLRERSRKRPHSEIDDSSKASLEDGPSTAKAVVPSTSKAADIYTTSGNINFFKDVESGELKSGKNAEHEAEARAEKEKWEKDVGLLTYLGQSSVERSTTKPWYLTTRTKDTVDPVDKDRRLKQTLDPMRDMKAYLHKHKHKHKDKDRDKHKSHKHKHKDKHKEKTDEVKQPHPSTSKSIEQLRAERLKREQDERSRTEAILSKAKGQGDGEPVEEVIVDERDRAYNSRYNPEFVRRPRDRRSY